MELLDIDVVQIILGYGSFTLVFGVVTIVVLELFIYGVVKALSFFRL